MRHRTSTATTATVVKQEELKGTPLQEGHTGRPRKFSKKERNDTEAATRAITWRHGKVKNM